jgi:hypothetical protein
MKAMIDGPAACGSVSCGQPDGGAIRFIRYLSSPGYERS